MSRTDWDERLRNDAVVRRAYDRLLASVGRASDAIGDRSVTPFFPEVGSAYRGTVVVGQATNEWIATHAADDFADAGDRADVVAATTRVHREREEQMSWLEDFPGTREADFWRSARALSESLEPDIDAPWYSRIAWVNLYPVAWQPRSGQKKQGSMNPTGPLRVAQNQHVPGLLSATLKALGSKRVVIYGGGYWWPTSVTAPFDSLRELPRPLQAQGWIDEMAVLVGYHPNAVKYLGFKKNEYSRLLVDSMVKLVESGR